MKKILISILLLSAFSGFSQNNILLRLPKFDSTSLSNRINAKQDILTNPIVGTGTRTVNIIPKLSATNSITNSRITDADTLITFGSNARSRKFLNDTLSIFTTPTADGQFQMFSSGTTGLVLAGRGSTNDVSIVNRSGASALRVPTNTTNVIVAGDLTAANSSVATSTITRLANSGLGSYVAPTGDGQFQIISSGSTGLVLAGRGSTNDVALFNRNGTNTLRIPTGTTNVVIAGSVTAPTGSIDTISSAKLVNSTAFSTPSTFTTNGQYQILSTGNTGLLLAGRGLLRDVSLVNRNGTIVLGILTGSVNVNLEGGLVINKDSVPLTTANRWGLTIDTTNNRVQRIQLPSSNTYTPTLTNTTNISAATLSQATFVQVGNIVTVNIGVTLTPTASPLNTVLTVTLPVNTATTTQDFVGSGTVFGNLVSNLFASGIVSITSASQATFTFYATAVTPSSANFQFQYKIN